MEVTINDFSNSLKGLIDEAKIYARKSWANILGVSEAALSQWTKGQTMPQPQHIESILTVSRNEKLTEYQQKCLNSFVASLENAVENSNSWNDSSREKISDYLIKQRLETLNNGINTLFYDLKLEFVNQQLREFQIIREDLEFVFCDIKEADNITTKAKAYDRVNDIFKDEAYRPRLEAYTEKIRQVHYRYLDELRKCLKSEEILSRESDLVQSKTWEEFLNPIILSHADEDHMVASHLNTGIKNASIRGLKCDDKGVFTVNIRGVNDGLLVRNKEKKYQFNSRPTITVDIDKAVDWLVKGAEVTDTVKAIFKYKGILYKKHLLRYASKGTLTMQAVEEKYQQWLLEHKAKVIDNLNKDDDINTVKVNVSEQRQGKVFKSGKHTIVTRKKQK